MKVIIIDKRLHLSRKTNTVQEKVFVVSYL